MGKRFWIEQGQGQPTKLGGRHFWEGQIGLVGRRWEVVAPWGECHFQLQRAVI